jgi:Tfp pilus assembly protein PilN
MYGTKKIWSRNPSAQAGKPGRPLSDDPVRRQYSVRVPRRFLFGRHIVCHIDDDSVHLAASVWMGLRCRLLDAQKIYISESLSSVEARDDFVAGTVETYIREKGGRHPSLVAVIGGPQTAFRTFFLPALNRDELDQAVRYEAKRQIPFPIEDCELDYRILQRIREGKHERLKIALLATTKLHLHNALEPLDRLNCPVAHVYHAQDVLGHLLRELPEFDDRQAYALINVNRNQTEISYYRGSDLEFFHVSSLGSAFLANRSDPTTFDYFSESVAGEIQNSLDYYTGQFSAGFANRLFVYGDLSYTDDLVSRLSDRFGFRFERFPTEKLSSVSRGYSELSSTLPVCLPAIAAACCRIRSMNLLPAHRKEKNRKRMWDRLATIGLAALVVSLSVTWSLQRSSVGSMNRRLDLLNQEIRAFEQSTVFNQYSQLRRQIAMDQNYLDLIRPLPSYLSLNLKELSHVTPDAITLTSLDIETDKSGPNLYLIGVASHADIPPEVVLAEFVANLDRSKFYHDVSLIRYNKRRSGDRFELEFQISARGTV